MFHMEYTAIIDLFSMVTPMLLAYAGCAMAYLLNASTQYDNKIEAENAAIYNMLKALAETDKFSKVRMSFNEQCTKNIKKCSATECNVPGMALNGEDGVIDLLRTPESYSPHGYTGRAVWEEIYKDIRGNEKFERLVSGLHYSVGTHIAAFHTKIFGRFVSHPLYFQKRFSQKRKYNFYFLYRVLRNGVSSLADNMGEIPIELGSLIEKINQLEEDRDEQIQFSEGAVKGISGMVKHLACLNCQKCRLWGTIQLRGLRSAVKALNGVPLLENEVILLVNAFRRVSESVVQSQRLAKMSVITWRVFCVYYYQTLIAVVLLLALILVLYRNNKRKKLFIEKL